MGQRALEDAEIERVLLGQRVVRVAFSADGSLYLLPLGYVWFHGALHLVTSTGQKTRMAASSARVAFQIDDFAATGMLGWSSVTGEGEWEVVTEGAVQKRALAALLEVFPELKQWGMSESRNKESAGALVFARIRPLWMTGRAFLLD